MHSESKRAHREQTVLDCLANSYGLQGRLERLAGENLNYLLRTSEGRRYVLKIVDDDMPPEVVDMEFRAIEHAISAGIQLNFPKIIPNNSEKTETGIEIHANERYRARLLDFVEGTNFENVSDISDILLENVGKTLAEFNLAMKNFEHPAANRNHRYNLAEAWQHRAKTRLVKDADRRKLLVWAFDTWKESAASQFERLPQQFIHGDANRGNVLIRDDQVVGLVDFGDSCHNPTICELAICMAYIMMDHHNPVEAANVVADGYASVRPLSRIERSVLYSLICGRLAVSISVAAERRLIDPDHPNWFVSEKRAWELLPKLMAVGSEVFV